MKTVWIAFVMNVIQMETDAYEYQDQNFSEKNELDELRLQVCLCMLNIAVI